MQNLIITLIQTDLAWENPQVNFTALEKRMNTISEKTDLIILPEMFATGFSMNADQIAQDMDGKAVTWIRGQADHRQCDITGSLSIREHGHFYNRLIWAKPGGQVLTYDKKHLFRYAGEEKIYTAGDKQLSVDLKGWKIRPFICYDLRFPLWCRNWHNAYDLAVYVANWPAKRAGHWKTLLLARAIENQCYVVGVNRVGTDGNGLAYSGDSAVIDPLGNTLFQGSEKETVHTISLSFDVLQEYRRTFPAWMDADCPFTAPMSPHLRE